MRERCFAPKPGTTDYLDFAPELADRQSLAEIVNSDASVNAAHNAFVCSLRAWWKKCLPDIVRLAPSNGNQGNVYAARRALFVSVEETFRGNTLLDDHQVRGALARFIGELKADLKSIAASGWGPELIPDSDIVQSQFPEVLADMESKRGRLAELNALFAATDEEDYEDSEDAGVLPSDWVKALKASLKELKGELKLAKRDPGLGDWREKETEIQAIEEKLARHKALEDEARRIKAEMRAAEKREQELVEAARQKIDKEEARRIITERMENLLVQTYESYLEADQRACLAAIENLRAKYADTAEQIERRRDEAATKLKGFLRELGYE